MVGRQSDQSVHFGVSLLGNTRMEISAKSLRSRVGDILSCVDRGESVTITYRGKPRARLVGIEDGGGAAPHGSETFLAFGMWRDRDDLTDVDAHVRGLREGRRHAD